MTGCDRGRGSKMRTVPSFLLLFGHFGAVPIQWHGTSSICFIASPLRYCTGWRHCCSCLNADLLDAVLHAFTAVWKTLRCPNTRTQPSIFRTVTPILNTAFSTCIVPVTGILQRDTIHKRSLCRHAVSVCPSVWVSVTFAYSVKRMNTDPPS